MENEDLAMKYAKDNPNLTWDEVMEKYDGDYDQIIKKSMETNPGVDAAVEAARKGSCPN